MKIYLIPMILNTMLRCVSGLLVLLSSASLLRGSDEKTALQLKILADIVQQQSVRDLDAMVQEKETEVYILRLSFLLKNVSADSITVASRCQTDAVLGCERFLVSVNLTARGGVYPKPSASEIGLVEIDEGQFALVGEYTCKFSTLDEVPAEVFATYVCDDDLASFYRVWTGTVRAQVETHQASELK